jgi:peroxiredoxin
MSGKKAEAVRPVQAPKRRSDPNSVVWMSWRGGLVAGVVVAVLAASFVVPKLVNGGSGPAAAGHAGMAMDAGYGKGLSVGEPVPQFSEVNVVTGQPITSQSLSGRKTLLFFSEGVMCQACFQQIKGLEEVGADLSKRGIELVSITPDNSTDLKQAITQYGITTPMIADDDRTISEAFNTLGKGMHADTPGHAFALIEKGKVLWYRDYWLPPDSTMYVEPAKLLAQIPTA